MTNLLNPSFETIVSFVEMQLPSYLDLSNPDDHLAFDIMQKGFEAFKEGGLETMFMEGMADIAKNSRKENVSFSMVLIQTARWTLGREDRLLSDQELRDVWNRPMAGRLYIYSFLSQIKEAAK